MLAPPADVPMPPSLARRPRDHRGFPIPYTVAYIEGKPDFRVSDPQKWMRAARNRRCAICGERIQGLWVYLIGGPATYQYGYFLDPPMDEACARYALAVCPFLALPNFGYRKSLPRGAITIPNIEIERPDTFGLFKTASIHLVPNAGQWFCKVEVFAGAEWFPLPGKELG